MIRGGTADLRGGERRVVDVALVEHDVLYWLTATATLS
jgi:hypothetical protein